MRDPLSTDNVVHELRRQRFITDRELQRILADEEHRALVEQTFVFRMMRLQMAMREVGLALLAMIPAALRYLVSPK